MSVSKIQPQGGANDFTLDIGASGNTTFDLAKEYPAGSYSISSQLADSTLDIYAITTDGLVSGYTNTKAFTATNGFTKIVVLGASPNDLVSFTYKTTYSPTSKGADLSVGPYVTSISSSSMLAINDSITVNGGNFANDVAVEFVGTNNIGLPAKSIVRISNTQLIVTRPDSLSPDNNPYDLVVTNPGTYQPYGSSVNILSNAISAGSSPIWQTPQTLPAFSKNSPYSTTIVASDTEGSSILYSIVSGVLPSGISLNQQTGLISGTTADVSSKIFTVRATDTGGNYVDRQFTLPNASPVWTTASGSLTAGTQNVAYSYQLSAIDDASIQSYSIVAGSLPPGLSLSPSGLISGTPTNGNGSANFTVRATDNGGQYSERTFNIPITLVISITSTQNVYLPASVSSFQYALVSGGGGTATFSSNGGSYDIAGGGGGAGGYISGTTTVPAGSTLVATVGAGGASANNTEGTGNVGGTTSIAISGGANIASVIGGGAGSMWGTTASLINGACGGGTRSSAGGVGSIGYNGGGSTGGQYYAGGGGGMSSAGQTVSSSAGNGGAGILGLDGLYYCGGGAGTTTGGSSGSASSGGGTARVSGSANTGGGAGGTWQNAASVNYNTGQNGGSGKIIIKYLG